ncbi:hypothetical protein AXF42_Ash013139 [Apostasia shenzhenica]|uniref:DUF4408 domain-containing protein n=1 Tax=Apostasia shenzhenica TaxID=1088818 RepID=A0A2I0BD54_9ASPA|nr:hypothetical protein AXF42_Ash013139 [Apostasia shenzhenica]
MDRHSPNMNDKTIPFPCSDGFKPPKAKKISISILVIFLPVLYASLLHVPPANLIKDTTFWFLISNSIIIIVATDSTVFSSSGEADDIYDDFARRSTAGNDISLPVPLPQPSTSAVVPLASSGEKQGSGGGPSPEIKEPPLQPVEERGGIGGHSRSFSSVGTISVGGRDEEKDEKVLRRSVTEPPAASSDASRPTTPASAGEEEGGYWSLSDEELNRRVEEFITRFNREIMLEELIGIWQLKFLARNYWAPSDGCPSTRPVNGSDLDPIRSVIRDDNIR